MDKKQKQMERMKQLVKDLREADIANYKICIVGMRIRSRKGAGVRC